MSAQAGILYFDGRPIDPGVPRRLDAQLAEFGPDGSGHHLAAGLVMVHRALHVTPEDCLERQPYVSEHDHVMTWDGRLDNREDLMFQMWRDLRDDTTDVALAMAAYEKWGEDAFARLIGDWSLAVWNANARSITLASDFMGVRPLYYHTDAGRIVWSTSLGFVLTHVDDRDLDPRFLVGYIGSARRVGVTPYRRIAAVAAGQSHTWTHPGEPIRHLSWTPCAPPIRYRNQEAYAEHLRTVFRDAVRVRLRSRRPVWAELSGGLDSSSIVCMATDLTRRRLVAAPAISTISCTSELVRVCDETRFIEEVERHLGQTGRHLRREDVSDLEDERGAVTPLHPTGWALAELRTVREAGDLMVLSGSLGDLIMGNSVDASLAVLEDLADGAPARALANLRAWSRSSQEPIWTLVWRILLATGPRRLAARNFLREALHESGPRQDRDWRRAICEQFLLTPRAAALWEQNTRTTIEAALDIPMVAKRRLAWGLLGFVHGRSLESPSDFAAVRTTYPYLHRPLVEFVLGMPLGELCRPGEPRALMRRAFRPLLPPLIVERRSKGYVAPFQQQALHRQLPSLLDRVNQLQLVQSDVIDPQRFKAKLHAVQHGANRSIGNLSTVVKLERWLTQSHTRMGART